jgi:hypothetical protein
LNGKAPAPSQPAAPKAAQAAADAEALDNGWLADGELVDAAYAETMAGGELQTSLPPPEPQVPPPQWLLDFFGAIGDFFVWSAPVLKYVLWALAAALLLFLLYRFVPGFAAWADRLRARRAEEEEDVTGIAEASAARARLADADALAGEGRFAEAVHMLLYRSVEDISAQRPGLVRPALTSRDISLADGLPSVARGAFARIARAVEVSLFGGRSVDAGVWAECRAAYAELTVPQNWVGA